TLDLALPENQKNPQALLKVFTPEVISRIAASADAVVEFEKKSGKKIHTQSIADNAKRFKPQLLNYAVGLAKENRNKEAADVLYGLYLLDKTDQDNLYYAASYAVNAKEYDTALKYYGDLKKLNYTGEKTLYTAKSKLSEKYETFN